MSEPIPPCGCGSATEVSWAPAFGRWCCPECRRRLCDAELGDEVTPLPVRDGEPPLALAGLTCRLCGWLLPVHPLTCPMFPWPAVLVPAGPLITGLPAI